MTEGGAAITTQSNAVPRRVRAGSLGALKRKLWRALLASEALLDHDDPGTRLRAVHALSQTATAYKNVFETADLEGRLAALEQASKHRDP